MSTYTYIYIRKDMDADKGKTFVNVHYLEGYNPSRIQDFQRMARKMKRMLCEVQIDDIECGQVTKSSHVYGFTLTRWNGEIKLTKERRAKLLKVGWHIVESGRCEYCW